tara:strand:+ start:615 stop:1169 length:555 start_codon:yes stop_codon:yes gene_type:complete
MDIWIANESSSPQVAPNTNPSKEAPIEKVLPLEETIQIKPFFLEGSVDDFDPVSRAKSLTKTLPRKLCGTFLSFQNKESSNVQLNFSTFQPIGQMILLEGEIFLADTQTKFTGILNAKSDQLEILPLSDNSIAGLDPGGYFVGLQGTSLFTWKSSKLDNPGGRLELKDSCEGNLSKTPILQFIL